MMTMIGTPASFPHFSALLVAKYRRSSEIMFAVMFFLNDCRLFAPPRPGGIVHCPVLKVVERKYCKGNVCLLVTTAMGRRFVLKNHSNVNPWEWVSRTCHSSIRRFCVVKALLVAFAEAKLSITHRAAYNHAAIMFLFCVSFLSRSSYTSNGGEKVSCCLNKPTSPLFTHPRAAVKVTVERLLMR